MNRRRIAVSLALLYLLCLGFSCLYIAAETEHDCLGESCVICCVLSACETFLTGSISAAVHAALGSGALYAPIRRFPRCPRLCPFATPVTMHTLLLD